MIATTLTTENPPPPSTYTECGADPKRVVTIAPGSVRLSLADGGFVELAATTWEYGFSSDAPLELYFECVGSFTCTVNNAPLTISGAGPHWSCNRPQGDDETYSFRFRALGTTGEGLLSNVIKPTAAQPTLIIRTKRNCPTGLSTKPTLDE